MKSLFWILPVLTLYLAACGQNSHSLTGRSPGKGTPTATNEKVEGAFTSPPAEVTETKKLQENGSGQKRIRIQKEFVLTGYLCTNDLLSAKAQRENDALKIAAGSQIIVGQEMTKATPAEGLRKAKVEKPKPVLNIICMKATAKRDELAGLTAGIQVEEEIKKIRMDAGDANKFSMKLGNATQRSLKSVIIGCITKEQIAQADKMLSQSMEDGADLLMAAGSTIEFETAGEDDIVTRLVVACTAKTETPREPTDTEQVDF